VRLAGLALMPLGKQIVSISEARATNAQASVAVSAPGDDR
jgi:hypothetical protein